jgi:DNA-binding MarR family transcriptional regulator
MLPGKHSTDREAGQLQPRDELVDAFLTASRVLVGVAVRSIDVAAPEITVTQHRVLVLLASHGPQRISDLARHLRVNSSNATRHCDRLQRLGLVARKRSGTDRRTVCVSLTDAGGALVCRVTEVRRAELREILETMPDTRVDDLVAALRSFGEAAGEPTDDHWATGPEPAAGP